MYPTSHVTFSAIHAVKVIKSSIMGGENKGSSGKNDLNAIRQVEIQAVCLPSITRISRNMD